MTSKYALLIANTEYSDSQLNQLFAPGKDAEEFARVLRDRDIGTFDDVKVLLNENEPSVRVAIDEFFDQKKPDDLLLLYFSGHGVRDENGALYLALKNTNRARLRATALRSDFIREAMDQSRSKRILLILDCCNSGAFAQGTKAMTGGSVGTASAFEGNGYGRIVLTASDSTQFAWEGDKIIGETQNSLFTHYLVKGLEGEADRDGDGCISVDELYDFAYGEIVQRTPKQTPGKWSYKQQGEIFLRTSIHLKQVKPVSLPNDLIEAIEDTRTFVREGAVQQLEKLLYGKNLGLARSAKETLERMAVEDDSTRVKTAALQALEAIRREEQLASQKAEEERLERKRIEAQQKAAAEKKAEEERLERERMEALKRTEEERLEKERIEAVKRAEAERKAKEEEQRLAEQKAKVERLAREKVEAEQQAEAERKAYEESKRLAAQKAEAERLEREKLEAEQREKKIPADNTPVVEKAIVNEQVLLPAPQLNTQTSSIKQVLSKVLPWVGKIVLGAFLVMLVEGALGLTQYATDYPSLYISAVGWLRVFFLITILIVPFRFSSALYLFLGFLIAGYAGTILESALYEWKPYFFILDGARFGLPLGAITARALQNPDNQKSIKTFYGKYLKGINLNTGKGRILAGGLAGLLIGLIYSLLVHISFTPLFLMVAACAIAGWITYPHKLSLVFLALGFIVIGTAFALISSSGYLFIPMGTLIGIPLGALGSRLIFWTLHKLNVI